VTSLIHRDSLALTLDAIAERSLSKSQRREVGRWIAGRQGLAGSYAGMAAPTAKDFRQGHTVFTGERVRSRAATAHILGEEAGRALLRLGVPAVKNPIMLARLNSSPAGFYCCGICTIAFWRHLLAGGFNHQRTRLRAGLRVLKSHRLGNGQWRRFPFWYTLLALSEMNLPAAQAEMRYAAPVCQRHLRRRSTGKFAARRRQLAEKILNRAAGRRCA